MEKSTILILSRVTRRFFEGEGTTAVADPPAAAPNTPPNPNPNPNPPPATQPQNQGRTYTEAEFNRLVNTKLSEQKRLFNEEKTKTIQQLQQLQQTNTLTETQKAELATRIEELEASMRTVEEQKKIEVDKLVKKYEKDTSVLISDRDSWKNRFERNMIRVDITNAAIKHEAVAPEQIMAILVPMTRCQEKMDDASKPTGEFATRVKFTDFDAEGKELTLDLDTTAAVKLMRDRPQRFGNLFKNTTQGGTGGGLVNPNPAGAGSLDVENMSPEQYRANRKQIHQKMREAAGK